MKIPANRHISFFLAQFTVNSGKKGAWSQHELTYDCTDRKSKDELHRG